MASIEEHLKQMIGDLTFRLAVLATENDWLRQENLALKRGAPAVELAPAPGASPDGDHG
jgi:hypothetical protein